MEPSDFMEEAGSGLDWSFTSLLRNTTRDRLFCAAREIMRATPTLRLPFAPRLPCTCLSVVFTLNECSSCCGKADGICQRGGGLLTLVGYDRRDHLSFRWGNFGWRFWF